MIRIRTINRFLAFVLIMCLATVAFAQDTMHISFVNGTKQDIPIASISDISFTKGQQDTENATIVGSWLWGKQEAEYYELLTFNADHTYVGLDCYFGYGFNTKTYGTYARSGIMLNLFSNGYGYQRIYRWFLTGLTDNALEVMTQMGTYVYYRLQNDVLRVKVGEEPMEINGYNVVFADGVTVKSQDGKLVGTAQGNTYILVSQVDTGNIVAFNVIVE